MGPEQVALKAAIEFEAWAAERRARDAVARDEPLPGVKRMTWRWPATWGAPLYVYPSLLHGYRIESLGFANGEQVKRMRVRVSGYDDDQPPTQDNNA